MAYVRRARKKEELAMSQVTLLLIAEILWVGGLCAWIVMERRSPQATLAWIFALAWLPYVGIFLYFLIGPRRLTRKRRRYALARSRVVQITPEMREAGLPEHQAAELDPAVRQLTDLVHRADASRPVRTDRLEILFNGDACFDSMEEAIRQARHHVHLEYYIWEPDRTGTRFRDLLCHKAREGVHVRLLLDAIGSASLGRRFLRPLLQAGGEVAWFNRISFSRLRPGMMNFRTHRKIVVCDGRVGFTGGMNVCDDQAASVSEERAWRDTHARLEGPVAHWLQRVFLDDWYFATGGGPNHAEYFPCDSDGASGPWVQIVASGPDCDRYAIHKLYFAAIAAARRRVLLTTPYFVPDEAILEALVTAAMRGADVCILVPRRTDSLLVSAAARSYFDDLLRAGAHVYEYGPNMIHAKTLVVDDMAFVGTANMDNRSFRLNFEVMVAIYDAASAELLAAAFIDDLRFAKPYTGRLAKRTPFRERLIQSTARLFSPLL
jgi:cardiolipin synthase A/B